MNYLQLCQAVARDSGTVSGTQPASVSSQTGRLQKIVELVAEAWNRIQLDRPNWRWMWTDFTGATLAGTGSYTPAALNLTRVRRWDTDADALTVYLTATGVSDEHPVTFMEWAEFRRKYRRGEQTANRPVAWSVNPSNNAIELGPVPDDAYTLNGAFWKSEQTLAANTDIPELPAEHHRVIKWLAVALLHGMDEGLPASAIATGHYRSYLDKLERNQLDPFAFAMEPLA